MHIITEKNFAEILRLITIDLRINFILKFIQAKQSNSFEECIEPILPVILNEMLINLSPSILRDYQDKLSLEDFELLQKIFNFIHHPKFMLSEENRYSGANSISEMVSNIKYLNQSARLEYIKKGIDHIVKLPEDDDKFWTILHFLMRIKSNEAREIIRLIGLKDQLYDDYIARRDRYNDQKIINNLYDFIFLTYDESVINKFNTKRQFISNNANLLKDNADFDVIFNDKKIINIMYKWSVADKFSLISVFAQHVQSDQLALKLLGWMNTVGSLGELSKFDTEIYSFQIMHSKFIDIIMPQLAIIYPNGLTTEMRANFYKKLHPDVHPLFDSYFTQHRQTEQINISMVR